MTQRPERAVSFAAAEGSRPGMDRKPLDATAFALMILLTALWGFQQVTIKVAAADVSLVMQAAIRSTVATLLLIAWAGVRGVVLFRRDETFWPGLAAGLLFAGEFVFIYAGLGYTTASRMIVFLYLTPPLTALGLHWFVPGERLSSRQWLGVLLAFGGVCLAFAEGFLSAGGTTAVGDLFGVIAAGMWAATTVLIRASALARVSATRTLFYQLVVSAVALFVASRLLGEPGVVRLTAVALGSLAYQGVIVAFASYLVWFWLLTRYLAARLAVFSFLAPMFGVLFGVVLLSEPLTPFFAGAALLVGGGIVLVNLRRA
jgi:drug/metabolite transporter (DMT)-like permease